MFSVNCSLWPCVLVLLTLASTVAPCVAIRLDTPAALDPLWSPSNSTTSDGRPLQRLWDGRLALLDSPTRGVDVKAATSLQRRGAEDRRRWAVCIVGQLSRLEIPSKVQNLLNVLENDLQAEVDVFVVLETGANYFVNPGTNLGDDLCSKDGYTPQAVRDMLSRWFTGGLFVQHEDMTGLNMNNFPHYGETKSGMDRKARLGLHFQQWTHIASCAELVKRSEQQQQSRYTNFLKLRDSSVVTLPFRDAGEAYGVKVKKGQGWGGVSDKVLYSHRQYFEAAVTNVLQLARNANAGKEMALQKVRTLQNPEQMLRVALEELPVQLVEADELPMVDGRCFNASGRRLFCLVPTWKDEHPSGALYSDVCPQLDNASAGANTTSNTSNASNASAEPELLLLSHLSKR